MSERPVVRAPYSRDALALNVPLSPGAKYTVDSAAVSLVGAAGTWDAADHWTVSLQSRTAGLEVVETLATAAFQTAGAGTVPLTPQATVDPAQTPNLTLALGKVGQAPPLLSATGSVQLSDLLPQSRTTYTYDANGNTTAAVAPSGTTTYTWDGENRLTAVTEDGLTEHHAYAATGLRRRKGETSFVWDGQNLLAELDAALGTLAQYTDFADMWGGLSSERRDAQSLFYGFDMAGNTRALLDRTQAVVANATYTAFGLARHSEATANPFGYGGEAGYYCDSERRTYVRARHLDTGLGRWMSPDASAATVRRPLLYRYEDENPLVELDPSGHDWFGRIRPVLPYLPTVTGPCGWCHVHGRYYLARLRRCFNASSRSECSLLKCALEANIPRSIVGAVAAYNCLRCVGLSVGLAAAEWSAVSAFVAKVATAGNGLLTWCVVNAATNVAMTAVENCLSGAPMDVSNQLCSIAAGCLGGASAVWPKGLWGKAGCYLGATVLTKLGCTALMRK